MPAIKLKPLRESFFKTVFSLLGHIANCDGYVNRDEIKRTQTFMERMKLTPECKREAIGLFRAGSSPQFNMDELLKEFSAAAEQTPTIIEVLLVYLISLARIDGLLVEKEIKLVREVAAGLHYSNIIFDHLLRMVAAQDKFSDSTETNDGQFKTAASADKNNSGKQSDNSKQSDNLKQSESFRYGSHSGEASQRGNADQHRQSGKNQQEKYFATSSAGVDLTAAYEALGVAPDIDDLALKKAYRKLASQFHPDKLQGQGLPPELVSTATDRFKKIQGAYDYIKKNRQ